MTSFDPTRRRALGALAASPVALTLPAEAAPPMTPQERLEHYFEGMANAMADMAFGKWEVRVVSGNSAQGLCLRQIGNPQREAMHHLEMALRALEDWTPGRWRMNTNFDHAFALIIRNDGPLRADDVTGTTAYADWERSKISS